MAGGKRILIADDDPDIVDLLESYYTKKGHSVSVVINGKEALQKLESEKFDLVLMDVMMPYVDGYHVAYEITSKLGAEAPRIIIMTSRDVASEKGIAMLSGALEVLQKPFTLSDLDKKVAAVLDGK
ncbi:MAG: response regulator transcription factor [Elusimicrobiales bacterium]|jgi:DNA-binding response OmpR family regulator